MLTTSQAEDHRLRWAQGGPCLKMRERGPDGGKQSAGLRSSCDSPLEGDEFELPVPLTPEPVTLDWSGGSG